MIGFIVFLAVIGACFGSFAGAVVWRVHKQSKQKSSKAKSKYSISQGRSMCEHCGHALSTQDLLPVVSFISLRGKCRYCKKPIATTTLLIELTGAFIFVLSYIFWPVEISSLEQVIPFVTWLLVSVGLLALALYDFRWYLLPNRILYPTFYVALAGWFIYMTSYNFGIKPVLMLLLSIGVASGIFWAIYILSRGRLIGYGDVRLGLITGTVLADPRLSLLMIFLASLLGTLFAVPQLIAGKKTTASRIPYGPFLILGTGLSLLFGDKVIDWYIKLLIF